MMRISVQDIVLYEAILYDVAGLISIREDTTHSLESQLSVIDKEVNWLTRFGFRYINSVLEFDSI